MAVREERYLFFPKTDIDRELEKLGIYKLVTPIPFPGLDHVNAYLIRDSRPTLIDVGLGTSLVYKIFVKRLAQLGYELRDIRRIYLTHGHLDHYGLGKRVVDESGAQVYIHREDRSKVEDLAWGPMHGPSEDYSSYFEGFGLPAQLAHLANFLSEGTERFARPLKNLVPLEDGQKINFDRFNLEVVHTPGHTPGLVCFLERRNRLLFSGDHLLSEISPNPVMEFESFDTDKRFKPLVEYMKSIEKIEEMELRWILPGHGDYIFEHRKLIDSLRLFYQLRQKAILRALKRGERNVYEIVKGVFPRLPDFEVFLAVSEVIGNLEVLEEKKLVERYWKNGKLYFKLK